MTVLVRASLCDRFDVCQWCDFLTCIDMTMADGTNRVLALPVLLGEEF